MASSTVSSIPLFLLLVFSFYMDEALGAHTNIPKLEETTKMRRNLEGNNAYRSSKMWFPGSESSHCESREYHEIVVTNYLPDDYSSPCIRCNANSVCYRCTKIRRCASINGSPQGCDVTETCCVVNNT